MDRLTSGGDLPGKTWKRGEIPLKMLCGKPEKNELGFRLGLGWAGRKLEFSSGGKDTVAEPSGRRRGKIPGELEDD